MPAFAATCASFMPASSSRRFSQRVNGVSVVLRIRGLAMSSLSQVAPTRQAQSRFFTNEPLPVARTHVIPGLSDIFVFFHVTGHFPIDLFRNVCHSSLIADNSRLCRDYRKAVVCAFLRRRTWPCYS